MERKWNDALVSERIMQNYMATGKFPTASFLKETGQNDLSCEISRTGGLIKWADRLGIKRDKSNSDTGWDGELGVQEVLEREGMAVCRSTSVKWPFDLLVNGVLRIDVKAAKHAKYGPCSGWFYRIGKAPQADLIALFQIDTKEVYWIPWFHIPQSNVTISKSGGIYAAFRNNMDIVKTMLETRVNESKWLDKRVLKMAA